MSKWANSILDFLLDEGHILVVLISSMEHIQTHDNI